MFCLYPALSSSARVSSGMNLTQSRSATLGAFALILIVLCVVAWQDGPDANWDLRNYHLYNGFAILNGRLGRGPRTRADTDVPPSGIGCRVFLAARAAE